MSDLRDSSIAQILDVAVCPAVPHAILVATEVGQVHLLRDPSGGVERTWHCHGGKALRVGWAGTQPIAWNAEPTSHLLWALRPNGDTIPHDIPTYADIAPTDDGFFVACNAVRLAFHDLSPDGTASREQREVASPGRYSPGTLTASRTGAVAIHSEQVFQVQTRPGRWWQTVSSGAGCFAFSPSGRWLALSTFHPDASYLYCYRVTDREITLETTYAVRALPDRTTRLVWSEDEHYIAVHAQERDVRVYARSGWVPGLWTSSNIAPAFHREQIITVPESRDRLLLHPLDGAAPKAWIRFRTTTPATFEISGNATMRRGDKVITFERRPRLQPTAIYEVVTGPRKDDDTREKALGAVVCRLRLGFPPLADTVRDADQMRLDEIDARDGQEISLISMRALLERLYANHATELEQLRIHLAVPTTVAATEPPGSNTSRLPEPQPSTVAVNVISSSIPPLLNNAGEAQRTSTEAPRNEDSVQPEVPRTGSAAIAQPSQPSTKVDSGGKDVSEVVSMPDIERSVLDAVADRVVATGIVCPESDLMHVLQYFFPEEQVHEALEKLTAAPASLDMILDNAGPKYTPTLVGWLASKHIVRVHEVIGAAMRVLRRFEDREISGGTLEWSQLAAEGKFSSHDYPLVRSVLVAASLCDGVAMEAEWREGQPVQANFRFPQDRSDIARLTNVNYFIEYRRKTPPSLIYLRKGFARELTPDRRFVLRVTYDHFRAQGDWPKSRDIESKLLGAGRRSLAQIGRDTSLFRSGNPLDERDQIRLTLGGLLHCSDSKEDQQLVVQLLSAAGKLARSQPSLRSIALTDLAQRAGVFDYDNPSLLAFAKLIDSEPDAYLHSSGPDISNYALAISPRLIKFADATRLEDILLETYEHVCYSATSSLDDEDIAYPLGRSERAASQSAHTVEVPKEQPVTRTMPTLFIGSTVEALRVARAVQTELEHDAYVTLWNQNVFGPSSSTWVDLVNDARSGKYDFAVMVYGSEDLVTSRGAEAQAPRDNVLLEFGLFTGALGRERVFFLYDRDNKPKIASDLSGVTPLTYSGNRPDGNIQAAVGTACEMIRRQIEKLKKGSER